MLWARHCAWLNSTPGKSKSTRRQQLERRETKEGVECIELEPPEVPEALEHVLEYLFEVGPGVGDHALTFGELESWQATTGVSLSEFEVVALRYLSEAYLAMRHEAQDSKCPNPYQRRQALPSKESVSNKLLEILRGMNTARAKADRAKRQRTREKERTASDDG